MDIQQLRQSAKIKWLSYYEQNRSWMGKMRVWGTYDGVRRPLSGFILATVAILEPQFHEVISFILSLNNNPDEIVRALGLNFNPDDELSVVNLPDSLSKSELEREAVPLQAVTAEVSTGEIQRSNLPRLHQPVSAYRTNREEVVSSVAVAAFPTHRMMDSRQGKSGLLLAEKPVRSPLAITMDILHKTKAIPSRKFEDSRFSHVPIQFSLLLLQINCLTGVFFLRNCLKPTVLKNGQRKTSPKVKDIPHDVNLSPSHHVSSLGAWVDECCQGRGYDPETAVSIRL
ncbi:DUF5331 domain-containing protein [Nodularia chucula]|uniref:DUF5331 domain-containing protein n=1 Tax=Nodularia chucula TaxID=3093667 RepID=UPI0039C65EF5